jgi:SseB protein N-terminal domain
MARSSAHQSGREGTAGDTAAVPWANRTLAASGSSDDDGDPDRALAEALRRRALSTTGDGVGEEDAAVVAALATARLLVPVVAMPAAGSGQGGDPGADLALVTLTSPGGVKALPVFSCVESLVRWDASARPVPVPARRAALSAVAEGCAALVLDPAGPVTFVVSRPALWAVGQGRTWTRPDQDGDLLALLDELAHATPGVTSLTAEPGVQTDLLVVVGMDAGQDGAAVRSVSEALSRALGSSDLVRERVDGLHLRIAPH